MADFDELRRLIDRFCRTDRYQTEVPGLMLIRSTATTASIPSIYAPIFCVAAQGRKRVVQGDALFEYGVGDYILASLDLPVRGEIFEASPEKPYLAASVALDTTMLTDLLLESPAAAETVHPASGLAVNALTDDLLDPLIRLLHLLERPRDIPVLAPMIRREIHFRLLQGAQGATLRQIALSDSRLSQVRRAIDWIRRHFDQPLRVKALADVAGMSESSFHRHFKAATAMSPLQYQKQIRLQEARRLLVSRDADAARVGFAVGYESPSQFSREYRRLFGAPPGRDAAALRTSGIEPAHEAG